jgi:hypothetical protein
MTAGTLRSDARSTSRGAGTGQAGQDQQLQGHGGLDRKVQQRPDDVRTQRHDQHHEDPVAEEQHQDSTPIGRRAAQPHRQQHPGGDHDGTARERLQVAAQGGQLGAVGDPEQVVGLGIRPEQVLGSLQHGGDQIASRTVSRAARPDRRPFGNACSRCTAGGTVATSVPMAASTVRAC